MSDSTQTAAQVLNRDEWDFTKREPWTLRDAVMQAMGGASACWEDLAGAGLFNSDRCKLIGEILLEEIDRFGARDG